MNRVKRTARLFDLNWRPQYVQGKLIKAVMRRHGLSERQARQLVRKGMGR